MWIGLLVTACLAASIVGQDCGRRTEHSRAKRIVGGHNAGHWPWMATLNVVNSNGKTKRACGATVIGERWVLTAQHCIENIAARHEQFTIVFGTRRQAEIIRRPKSVVKYSDFTAEHADSYAASVRDQDIALIELDQPLIFSFDIQPICLRHADDGVRDGTTLMKVIGYGLLTPSNGNQKRVNRRFPDRLQELDITIEDAEECARILFVTYKYLTKKYFPTIFGMRRLQEEVFPRLQGISQRETICAKQRGGVKGLCKGDSGGPLMKQAADGRWYLYGVAVTIIGGCGSPAGSSFFVDITRQCGFVKEATRGEVDCVEASD